MNKPSLFQQNKPNKSRPPYTPSLLIIFVFTLALIVLGFLSLHQHYQLQHLRFLCHRENFSRHQNMNLLTDHLHRSQRQVNKLVNQFGTDHKNLARLSDGVCFIQGEYYFVDPETELPLRYLEKAVTTQSLSVPSSDTGDIADSAPVGVSGSGDIMFIQFTGTGFLIDPRGYIVTNEHITTPWQVSPGYRHILESGYESRFSVFRAFFPGCPQSFDLTKVTASNQYDLALLHTDLGSANVPVLPCAAEIDHLQLQLGQTVMVLGYPTGFDLLLTRMPQDQIDNFFGDEGASFNKLARQMARQKWIQPIATRGMCGRVTADRIIYDAQTTIGASGAPVIGSHGRVIAVNTALLKGFSGSNLGIPVKFALQLLPQPGPCESLALSRSAGKF